MPKKHFKKMGSKLDKLVMGAIIGAAIGSVVGASLKKREQKKEGEPVEWFEIPEERKKPGFFARLFGFGKKKKKKEAVKEIPDESYVD